MLCPQVAVPGWPSARVHLHRGLCPLPPHGGRHPQAERALLQSEWLPGSLRGAFRHPVPGCSSLRLLPLSAPSPPKAWPVSAILAEGQGHVTTAAWGHSRPSTSHSCPPQCHPHCPAKLVQKLCLPAPSTSMMTGGALGTRRGQGACHPETPVSQLLSPGGSPSQLCPRARS